jgi:hypothetical protein
MISLAIRCSIAVFAGALLVAAVPATAEPLSIRATIENLSPTEGVYLTPLWLGFHDGSFDSYDAGSPASVELERLAEDGNAVPLSSAFTSAGSGRVDGVLGAAPIGPGASASLVFSVDPTGAGRYASYAAMVLPSNDYFVANDNPLALDLSTLSGPGASLEFAIGLAGAVYDAGTEVNDFATSAGNGLLAGLGGGQTGPDQGALEGGVILSVSDAFAAFANTPKGFDLSGLDFNDKGLYPGGIARLRFEAVPEASTSLLLAVAVGFSLRRLRHREL